MKSLRIIFLITFPLIALSCNNQSNQERNNSSITRDMEGAMGDPYIIERDSDEGFLKEAGSAGLMEVELGQYAGQNALNPRVKKFGSMMVKVHSRANEELKAIADKKNISVSMNDKHSGMMRELQQKRGEEFDKEYMKMMVDDHQKDIDKFEKQGENSEDADLKAFASKILPVLQMHLDSAKSIRDDLK